MSSPEPGDEVSFLKSTLRGKVKSRMADNRLLVLLEDGFEIPAHPSELVVTKRAESNISSAAPIAEQTISGNQNAQKDIYLAFSLLSSKLGKPDVHAYLSNALPGSFQYQIYVNTGKEFKGIAKGEIAASSISEIAVFPLDAAEKWKEWHLTLSQFKEHSPTLPQPKQYHIRLRETNIAKAKHTIPFLKHTGWLIPLGEPEVRRQSPADDENILILPEQHENPIQVQRVNDIVDLHIEEIIENGAKISGSEALEIQLAHFRNSLEKAYAFRLPKIIFIHGIGNGKLKEKLREELKSLDYIAKVSDANPARFGYGATEVVFAEERQRTNKP